MNANDINATPDVRALGEDRIRGQWRNIPDRVRRRWRKLTAEDVLQPAGDAEYLAERLQQRYGIDRREALLQIFEFECEI